MALADFVSGTSDLKSPTDNIRGSVNSLPTVVEETSPQASNEGGDGTLAKAVEERKVQAAPIFTVTTSTDDTQEDQQQGPKGASTAAMVAGGVGALAVAAAATARRESPTTLASAEGTSSAEGVASAERVASAEGADPSSALKPPYAVRSRPMLSTDRSESSGSESAPSPGESQAITRMLPPVIQIPIATSSGNAAGGGLGSGKSGAGDDNQRSARSTSSAGSNLLGTAFVTIPNSDSFDLSPEASPRRRNYALPTPTSLAPVRESSQERNEVARAIPVVSTEASKVAQAKDSLSSADADAGDVPPIAAAVVPGPQFSPLREPSDSLPATHSPLVVGGVGLTPSLETSSSEKPDKVATEAMALANAAPTPRASLSQSRSPESSLATLAVGSRHTEYGVSGAGVSDDESNYPTSILPVFDLHGAASLGQNSPSPTISRVDHLVAVPQHRRSNSEGGDASTMTRGTSSVWDTEDEMSMVTEVAPPLSPGLSTRTDSTLAGEGGSTSSVSVSASSASSAAASATAAAGAATLAATAAQAAADQASDGIWDSELRRREWQPRSAMARSAAAAGAKAVVPATSIAASGSSGEDKQQQPRGAESKGSLRVRDPGVLRLPSSQSTEAPTSKSISVVAPSPDGGGAYLFSQGGNRVYGSRRQSSLSSYPSFGFSSEDGSSSTTQSSVGQNFFTDAESSTRDGSTFSPPEGVFVPTAGLPPSSAIAMDTGSSSSGSPPQRTRRGGRARSARPDRVLSVSFEDKPATSFEDSRPIFHEARPSSTVDLAAVTPSAVPGGGDLFALLPARVEQQRRERSAGGTMAREAVRPEWKAVSASLNGQQPYLRQAPPPIAASPASAIPSAAPGGGTLFALEPAQVEHQRRTRQGQVAGVLARPGGGCSRQQPSLLRGVDDAGVETSDLEDKTGTNSLFHRATAALASAAKAATGRGVRPVDAEGNVDTNADSAHNEPGAGIGGAKRRLSGEVQAHTGEPEAKKMMAKAAEEGMPPRAGGAKEVGASAVTTQYESVEPTLFQQTAEEND